MRTIDDIAVTAETLLSLGIDGLPASDSALPRHAERNGWPVLHDRAGKAHFLVDDIPEPHGSSIREALGHSHPDAPAPFREPVASPPAHRRSEASSPRRVSATFRHTYWMLLTWQHPLAAHAVSPNGRMTKVTTRQQGRIALVCTGPMRTRTTP